MSHGFGADQGEDDVVILLTLEPVHCCHLRRHTNTFMIKHTHIHIKDSGRENEGMHLR